MTRTQRRFVAVEGRRVHYRQRGSGPPLVMLHGSPADSALLVHEMAVASTRFTCIAFDTPGFGLSDPLPGDVLEVRDLAAATVAAMRALGLPPCPVYGTHTGAAIGIELGVGWPGQVTGLVLEGLPIFTDAEIAAIFVDDYFAPLVVDPLGGHLFSTWIRFRDQFTWFPWRSRDVTRLNPVDRPAPHEIDQWVSMFYRSCWTYRAAYRAACFYGQRAYRAAEALTVPAVFMASAEDMLFPHLDRLPTLKDGQRVERLPYDPPAKYQAILGFAESFPVGAPTAPMAESMPVGHDPALQFIDTPDGQTFVRCFGHPDKPALFILHDGPGTGLAHMDLARALGETFYVIVPDLPGNGHSDAPLPDRSVLDASADAVLAIADLLGLSSFTLAGIGCGAAVAATIATRGDPRLTAIVLSDVLPFDPSMAASIAPDLSLAPEGTHWQTAWLMVRDGQIYRPWFDGRVASQRSTQGNFDARWLHDQTVALMTSRDSTHRLPREAAALDTAAALATSDVPIRICGDDDFARFILSTTTNPEHPHDHTHAGSRRAPREGGDRRGSQPLAQPDERGGDRREQQPQVRPA